MHQGKELGQYSPNKENQLPIWVVPWEHPRYPGQHMLKKILVIIVAILTQRLYLLGRKFFIKIDQRSLKYMMDQRIIILKQQKWVSKLFGYDYEIIYKPGKENQAADTLCH